MTDAQFGALLTAVIAGLGGIAGMIRWAVTRITKAMDDQSSSNLRLADAQIDLAGALSAQRADIGHITRWIYMHTPGAAPLDPTRERERTPAQPMPVLTPTGLQAFQRDDYEDTEAGFGERPGSQRRREAGPLKRTTAVRGVPIQQQRERSQNYRRSESNHDDDER